MDLEIIHEKPRKKIHATPLLFVHGKWHGAWCWAENFLPYFAARGYDASALSLRGHGRSEASKDIRWVSISNYVSDVAYAASRMETAPVIIGHSMGGFITQKYLENHSAPAAVLLASIPPYGLWGTIWMVFLRHPGVVMKTIATLRFYPLIATTTLAREILFSESMPEKQVTEYHRKLQDESFRAALDELGLNLVRTSQIKSPLLVLGGAADNVISPGMVHRTARIYNTDAVIFKEMAHDMMLERGWEAVADRILDFLKERSL